MRVFLASVLLTTSVWAAAPGFDHSHPAFNRVLQDFVTDGRVAFTAMKSGAGEKELDGYLAALQRVDRGTYGAFSAREKLAFWVNAYNANALKAVLRRWPTQSVKDFRVFSEKNIPLRLETDADVSLDDIEDVIVRKFTEPRAFLALSCGAKGMPRLRPTAYRADALEAQLDDAVSRAIGGGTLAILDVKTRTLSVGEPFRRHRTEFEARSRSLAGFVAPYLDVDAYDAMRAGPPPKVTFLSVDWSPSGY